MEQERTGIPSAVEDKDNNFNPFCTDGFFLLASYNKLGMIHSIYLGVSSYNFQITLYFFV